MKRWSFQKDRWNMIFLILSRKMIFLFPENMILLLGWEMKDDLFQKNTWKYIFFTHSEKMVCSETCTGIWSFLYYLERWYFSPRKHDIFSLGGKWRMIFFKKYVVTLRPTAKKNQTWPSPAKIHLKVIDALDWHSKESSNNYLCFCGGPYRRFHILLFSKENQEA